MAKKQIQAKVSIPENSLINQKIINDLDELFSFASPHDLRKSIDYIQSHFLIHMNAETPPEKFRNLAEDLFFLKTFLDQASDEMNSKTT
jgi:hypothetical protein